MSPYRGLGWDFRKRNRKLSLVPQGACRWGEYSLSGTFPIRPSPSLWKEKYALYCTKLEDWLFRRVWSWKRNKWSSLIKPDPNQRGSALIDLEENSVVEKTVMESSASLTAPSCESHIFLPCCELCGCVHPYKKGISSEVFERLNQTCPVWARESCQSHCHVDPLLIPNDLAGNITLQMIYYGNSFSKHKTRAKWPHRHGWDTRKENSAWWLLWKWHLSLHPPSCCGRACLGRVSWGKGFNGSCASVTCCSRFLSRTTIYFPFCSISIFVTQLKSSPWLGVWLACCFPSITEDPLRQVTWCTHSPGEHRHWCWPPPLLIGSESWTQSFLAPVFVTQLSLDFSFLKQPSGHMKLCSI